MKKLDNNIDFEQVSIEEAGKTKSPADQLAHRESLDNQYKVSDKKILSKPDDLAKINELTEVLNLESSDLELKKELSPKVPEHLSETDKAYNKIIKEYPQIAGADLGKAREIIANSNNKHEFQNGDKVFLPVTAFGMTVIVSQASFIPAYVAALAVGPTGVVTGTGLMVAGIFGVVPVVAGVAYLSYGGYKLFKIIQESRKLKRDQETLEKAWSNI